MVESALDIVTVEELERFDLGMVLVGHTSYTVLTSYEGPERRCFWCGGELKGGLKRYCYGHMTEYYNHFNWGYAKDWCIERYEHRCANCGMHQHDIPGVGYYLKSGMEVHHIIPVNGESRYFSAYNLPWNLIALCHECHLDIHAAMRIKKPPPDIFDLAFARGQAVMELCRKATDDKMPSM